MIVGLGNPGTKYEFTRHNLGFLAVKSFAFREGWAFKEDKKFSAQVAEGKIGDCKIALLMPTTYMNLSGKAVQPYLAYYGLSPQDLIVVTDDVYVEYGQMRFRTEGSAGGHNGLKSIEAHLGTQSYPRLRLGIGPSPLQAQTGAQPQTAEAALRSIGVPLESYVLNLFSPDELAELPPFLELATSALKLIALAADPKAAFSSLKQQKGSSKGSGE